jgi:hypothetical protein
MAHKEIKLTRTQERIIRLLKLGKEIVHNRIATVPYEVTETHEGIKPETIDRLLEGGYVFRNPKSTFSTTIKLTKKGEEYECVHKNK